MFVMRKLSSQRTDAARDERGAAMVLVAVALPVLVLFMAFGIEVGHWFDYSRNLQNRADAAALAAAVQYGGTCFGTATSAQTDAIGQAAQQYAGPPIGTPDANLPYPLSSIQSTNYKNRPNLSKGTPANFHMLLNSQQNWPSGANWNMGTTGHTGDSTALCSSRDEDGNVGAMVDVRLTQANLGPFFPLFGFRPTISAHARAALEGEASTNAAPIAVGDTGFTPCVSVRLIDASSNSVIQTITLSKEPPDPQNPTAPAVWDNSGSPTSFTMPGSASVYAQPFLSDCNGTGQIYDDSTNTGLLMINNHSGTDPTVNPGQPPQIGSGGVIAFGTCAGSTQYFSTQTGGCTVNVRANALFASDVTPASKAQVFLVHHTWDTTLNAWVTNSTPMNPPGNGQGNQCPATAYCKDVLIGDTGGIDQFSFTWEEDNGSIGGTNCTNASPCTGTFNNGAILQQVFGACNGCNQPDDSGPVVFAQVSEVNGAAPCQIRCDDTNSFAGGSQHNLVLTVKLSGLNTATFPSPPTVLRFSTSTNHQTGLIDCGQGNSGSNDSDVVYYGCGPGNPLFNPPLNPLFVYSRPLGSDCSPAADGNTTGWPNGNQQDCVQTTPGQRRQNIICPLVERIVGAPYPGNCQGGAQGTCPVNHWTTQDIQVGDPRAITMIITSPADFASAGNAPQFWLPIRKFATFYVTGWDKNIQPSCTGNGPSQNEAYPQKGKQNSDNGAVWGHWINYEDTAGTPNGQICVIGVSPTNCVPALTR
jgi:putative Flp pilus-assembly TadE/G-like protein